MIHSYLFTIVLIVTLLEQDFLKRICPDDNSHIAQSLSKLPEYKICSSALNRSAITAPLEYPIIHIFYKSSSKRTDDESIVLNYFHR